MHTVNIILCYFNNNTKSIPQREFDNLELTFIKISL